MIALSMSSQPEELVYCVIRSAIVQRLDLLLELLPLREGLKSTSRWVATLDQAEVVLGLYGMVSDMRKAVDATRLT